jgi:hypothetical protein
MNEKDFLEKYLWPSEDKLDRSFTFPLPDGEGLKNCGDFIIQCQHEDTFSTNIITKYESDSGIILKEFYKNTQNKVTGGFVRLVGGLSMVKNGYPQVSLDPPMLNFDPATDERSEITSRMFITMPQADPEQRKIFFGNLSDLAKEAGIDYSERKSDTMPDFWGAGWRAVAEGVNFELFGKLRNFAWSSYKRVIEETKEKIPFDYRPLQEHMVFNVAGREHLTFKRRGLSVPVEAQAAFFSALIPTF